MIVVDMVDLDLFFKIGDDSLKSCNAFLSRLAEQIPFFLSCCQLHIQMVNIFVEFVFVVGQICYFSCCVLGQPKVFFLLLVQNFVKVFNVLFLGLDGVIHPSDFCVKGVVQILEFLIFDLSFMCSLALDFIELSSMKSFQGLLFLFFVQVNLVNLTFKINLVIIYFSVQVFNLSFVLLPIFLQLLLSLLKFFTNIFVVNLQLLMLSGQIIEVTSSMLQLILKLRHLSLKFFNSCLKKFLFRLSVFGLFLFGQGKSLHFLVERFLDILHSLLMLYLIFIQHLLVHIDLLRQTLLNPISLLLDLGQSILKNTDGSLRLANFG